MHEPRLAGVVLRYDNGREFPIDFPVPRAAEDGKSEVAFADLCAAEAQGKRIDLTVTFRIKEHADA